jgi:hypothetical protein
VSEWYKHTKTKGFPNDMTVIPNRVYKKQWINWGDFLGTNTISVHLRKFRSYKEAKKYVQSFKVRNTAEWLKLKKSKEFPQNIPKAPDQFYAKEWKGWPDFLGTGRKPRSRKN